nr:reverse transcriptase domain-containing protein [Tanacetum cinerariifolium]
MATEENGDLPVPNLRTMKELCQPSLNGRGGPIAPIAIQATNFGLKNDMIQQVHNSCQFHGLPGDDANKHLDKFLHVAQSIKVNGVTDDALRLYLFPHSLTHHATGWFDRLLRNLINTFEQMAKMFLGKYFPPSMVTKLRNEITNFCQNTFYNGLTLGHRDTINAVAGGTFMKRRPKECYDLIENITAHHNDWDTSAQQSESSSFITSSFDTEIAALKAKMTKINKNLMRVLQVNQQVKAITPSCETCGGPHSFSDCPATVGNTQNVYAAGAYQAYQASVYQAPVHQPQIPQPQVVTTNEFTNFMKANDAILKNMQTNMTSLTNSNLELKNMFGQFIKMNTALSLGSGTLLGNTITNPKEDLKGITTLSETAYQGPTIPTTSSSSSSVVERETKATKDTVHPSNNGSTKDVQPSVVPTESPILNSEPVISPIIEPVASPLPEKLGDPGKFLISCDFLEMAECLALADLDASINLMPLSVWNKLSLPDLSPSCMTLELVDCLISRPVGVAKDVFVKVGIIHFLADFFVVDFDDDPRAITFNLDQTSRYSTNYNDMTANRIDVIDMACEKYSQEVLGFSNVIASGNATPYYDPIVSTTFSTLTLFENSDFLLEEVDTFLALEDDPTSPEVDQSYVDTEGDILILEAFLNDDPSLPPPNQRNYLPHVHKELKIYEATFDKSSIDEPPEVKLKDLPPYLEYIFLEGKDKFPVIIAKDLSVEEKTALITVLKSHKRAMLGNSSISRVLKLLDAGLIYPISDSPWVSPVYCVPKKGGFTVVENEENELILTRLVTGWRVCIDYRKLNEATRKDHFSLPFMDQMLKRLARNQYYCFLDGFSGYFQIPIDPKDQEKTIFTCPYGTFAYRCMFFGLCNAPGTFQRCMMAIFHDMIEKPMEVFMDDFSSYFMVKEGIVLGHKISKEGIEVDKGKVDVITKLPHPTTVKGIQSIVVHAGFYRSLSNTQKKLTEALILIAPDLDMPFVLTCNASYFAIGAVLWQHQEKHFRPIHYASMTITEAESNYTTTEKEMLAVVYAFEKFWSYLIMNKIIVYTDHSVLKYLFVKKDSKARLLRWVILLQEFTFKVIDTNGDENLAADHLSRLKNPHQNVLDLKEINESLPLETLNLVSTCDNSSTLWFADFANYHAGTSLLRECRLNRKANSSRM